MDKIMTLNDVLREDIKILKDALKGEDELKSILKRRLTKKEWKYFLLRLEKTATEDICKELDIDEKRYEEMVLAVFKKVNSEKIKQELIAKD